jgi:CPA1 family monovalent cation:H+ antiporter
VHGARSAALSDFDQGGIAEIPLDDDPVSNTDDDLLELTEVIDAPDGDDPREMLAQTALFASLDRRVLRQLVAGARLIELPSGRKLFCQGDRAGSLYLVADGAVVPIAEGPVRKKLAVLERGDFFGEIALFTNQPRSATIQALVDSQLVSIDRAAIRKLVAKHPEVLAVLLRFARERLIDRLVRTNQLFGALEHNERGDIARRFRFLEVADGRLLIGQDSLAEALFIILTGLVDVVHFDHDGEKTLGTLGPGDIIGEISLLSREPSLTAMVAHGKCWVLALPAQSFHRMLECYPRIEEVLARMAEQRALRNHMTVRDGLLHRESRIDLF